MDLSNESVEDRRNGNSIKYQISWIATLSKFTWVPDQGSCQDLHGVYRYDTWQIDELLHNAVSLVSTFQYEARDLQHDMVQATMLPWEDVLVSLGLDGTVVTIYDQNISRAVKSMQASPPCLMHEAIQKLGTIMQNRSLTTVTYPDVSKDFLLPMWFSQNLIAHMYKDIWSHKLTYYNAYSDALLKLYRSCAEVSVVRANIEIILAIH